MANKIYSDEQKIDLAGLVGQSIGTSLHFNFSTI